MRKLFSTDHAEAHHRFRQWREVCEERLVPMDQSQLGDDLFDAAIEAVDVGPLAFTKFTLSNLRAVTTPSTIRHSGNKDDQLIISIVQSGIVFSEQNGLSIRDDADTFTIRDTSTPWTIEHRGRTDVIAVALPRERLEGLLGSARNFVGVTLGDELPAAALARSFLVNLAKVGDRLPAAAAVQMAGIGVDLLVASMAERLAQGTPKELQGTVVVQRAKAYVETHLGNPTLDPPQLAAAIGVSLRRLQQLFHERGRHISEWIWQRRLEKAAQWLADPGLLHLQLGAVAYSCGFSSQAHFSRRFRDGFGMSPGEYRRQALARNETR